MTWGAVLLHSWQARWSDGGVWRGHGTERTGERRRVRMLTEMLGFLPEWVFSVEGWCCREPGSCSTLFCIYSIRACWLEWVGRHWFLNQHFHLYTGSSCCLVPMSENAGTDIKGQSRLATPQNIWISLLWAMQINKYKCTVQGMQCLAALVCDSQEDLCEPGKKESPRIPDIKNSVLFKLNLPFTYRPSLGLGKS